MYVAEQGTQHGDSKPMNCQSFVREDIKVRRRLKIAWLCTLHIEKREPGCSIQLTQFPLPPVKATKSTPGNIWGYTETRRGQKVPKDQSHNLPIEKNWLYYNDLGFSNTESFSPQIQICLHTMTWYKDSMLSCLNHPDTPPAVLFHAIIAPSVLTWCNIANLSWEEASEAL